MVLSRLLGASKASGAKGKKEDGGDEEAFVLYPPRTPSGLNPLDFGDFAKRIEAFRKAHISFPDHRTRGCLQILELDRVRFRFGRRWPSIKEKAFQMVESALHKNLGEHDVYVANGENEIYVFSTGVEHGAADTRGRLIAAEITGRLCGTVPGGTAIRVKTMPFDFGLGLQDVTSFRQLLQRVEAYGKTIDSAEIKLFNDNVENLRIRFRPTVAFREQIVRIYHSEIVFREEDGMIMPAGVICPSSVNGVFDFEIDKWAVDQIIPALAEAAGHETKPAIIVPLHFDTLSTMRFRDPFIELCRKLPESSTETLCFEIIGIPPSMPQSRVRELMAYIKPFCSEIVARLETDMIVGDHVESCGIGLLSLDIGSVDPEAAATRQALEKFAELARHLAMTPLLVNAWSISLSNVAYKAGVALLNGDAFMPAVGKPGKVIDLAGAS